MVKQAADDTALDRIFHALADSTRRSLLLRIAEKECTVTELAAPFSMSLNAISKHLKVLESAGLLTRTVDGRVHRCTMDGAPLEQVRTVVRRYEVFWGDKLDSLERFLGSNETKGKK